MTVREVLSLKEAIVLAEVSEERVRKDMERGVFKTRKVRNRNVAHWADVFAFSAIYKNDLLLSPRLRRVAFEKIDWTLRRWVINSSLSNDIPILKVLPPSADASDYRVELAKHFYVDMSSVITERWERTFLYAMGLSRVSEDPETANGCGVFKGTRLSVRHVGLMLKNGEPASDILEDYPYLNKSDLEFAAIYADAHPIPGRPRKHGGVGDVETSVG